MTETAAGLRALLAERDRKIVELEKEIKAQNDYSASVSAQNLILNSKVAELEGKLTDWNHCDEVFQKRYLELESKLTSLQELLGKLKKYAEHDDVCYRFEVMECECGLGELFTLLEKEGVK